MGWDDRRELVTQNTGDKRRAWDVDFSRVVHSASFRRLQGKTQVFNVGDSDFYRTRLTHTLEVAQIAESLVRQVSSDGVMDYLPTSGAIRAIAYCHDLGHPPFGHGGEVALNYCMRDSGGFEGNAQTLRIVARLEKFSKWAGSNLTRRTMLGVIKYPSKYSDTKRKNPALAGSSSTFAPTIDVKASKPPKCYYDEESDVVDWILEECSSQDKSTFVKFADSENDHAKPLHKSLDCSIMDLADDISFGVHDLEDAVAVGLITKDDFRSTCSLESLQPFIEWLGKEQSENEADAYDKFVAGLFSGGADRKYYIGRLVSFFVIKSELARLKVFEEPLLDFRLRLSSDHSNVLELLKNLVKDRVVKSPMVQHLESKGQRLVVSVFEAILADPKRLLAKATWDLIDAGTKQERVICDHISGMTDAYLIKIFERLFSPRRGSVFDHL